MGGEHIAAIRFFRLIAPMKATVTKKEFQELNSFKGLVQVILNEHMPEWIFNMSRSLYPLMRVLRLGDMKKTNDG